MPEPGSNRHGGGLGEHARGENRAAVSGQVGREADPEAGRAVGREVGREVGYAERTLLGRSVAFDTLTVHAGQEPDELTGAVAPPIYQTSTFAQDGVGRPRGGWEYARTANPTRTRLERALARLEGARHGLAFASGSAAAAAIAELLAPGDEVLIGDDVYGGTYRLFDRVMGPRGVSARYVDLAGRAPSEVRALLTEQTRLVWFESPTNPLLKIVEIEAVRTALEGYRDTAGRRPLVVVDNTFATPALQRPLERGADIVYHSATKYLAGHSDTVAGAVVTSEEGVAERLRFLQNAIGAVPGPFDCFLVLRGLRTLGLRMARHSENGLAVATYLAGRRDVELVRYPGLSAGPHPHPQAHLASIQMGAPGGMIAVVPRSGGRHGRSGRERAIAICESTSIFRLAESLGGVESLIELPSIMTHASVAGSPIAVPEALIRLSCGIEGQDDLVADLAEAFDRS